MKGHQFFVNRVKSKIKINISNKTKIIPSGDVYQNIDIAVKMAAKYIKNLKGILSTSCVIFSYPKLLSIFRTDLHKMKIKHRIIDEYAPKRCFFD